MSTTGNDLFILLCRQILRTSHFYFRGQLESSQREENQNKFYLSHPSSNLQLSPPIWGNVSSPTPKEDSYAMWNLETGPSYSMCERWKMTKICRLSENTDHMLKQWKVFCEVFAGGRRGSRAQVWSTKRSKNRIETTLDSPSWKTLF